MKLSIKRDRPEFPSDQIESWSDAKLIRAVEEVNTGFFYRPPVAELLKRFIARNGS